MSTQANVLVDLFNESEDGSGHCWGAEIGPLCVLELGDLTHRLKRLRGVGKCEVAHNDCWRVGC